MAIRKGMVTSSAVACLIGGTVIFIWGVMAIGIDLSVTSSESISSGSRSEWLGLFATGVGLVVFSIGLVLGIFRIVLEFLQNMPSVAYTPYETGAEAAHSDIWVEDVLPMDSHDWSD